MSIRSLLRLGQPCSGLILGSLLLAGCATGTRQGKTTYAPDWESEAAKAPPAKAPAVAPPTLSLRESVPDQPRPPAKHADPAWQSLRQWSLDHNLPEPIVVATGKSPMYSLNASNHLFVLQTGKDTASCDGLEIRLGFPPQVIDGQLLVHSLDLDKNIQPLMANRLTVATRQPKSVVIDPGHGGDDAGARSFLGLYYEKYYTLDWAQRLAGLLAADGWQVWLTRTNDSDVAVSNRVLFAESHKADLYISLHFNSAYPDHLQSGIETYCLTPAGMHSTITRGYEDDPGLVLANNAFDAQNVVLASRVHNELLHASGAHDRGVRRARFPGVLRNQQRPAVLVEGGYLSNPAEARRIGDAEYRQRLAEAIARALVHGDRESYRATAGETMDSSETAGGFQHSSTTAMP